jgi:predicted dehydrogenase
MFRFASGATATLGSVWHDVLSRPSQRRIEVFAQRALVTVEGEFFGPVRYQDGDEELVLEGDGLLRWLDERDVAVHSAQEQFLRAVRERLDGGDPRPPGPDVLDALRAHVVVDALYRSARDGGATVDLGGTA